jgi:hypothetical protein
MSQSENLEIEITIGEDFAAQIAWTDDDGEPMPVVTPCRLEARDINDVLVIQFATENSASAATEAAMELTGSNGIMQISAPRAVTDGLGPGRYRADLFATLSGGIDPFAAQQVQVLTGWVVVEPRVTKMEVAPS